MRRAIRILGAVVGALAVGALVWVMVATGGFGDAWSRSQLDVVAAYAPAKTPDPEWPYLDAPDRTSVLCGPVTNCVQAVRNDYLTILKFGSVEDATRYVEEAGSDAYQFDPLVVAFDGPVPVDEETRREILFSVGSDHAGSPD